jgi:NADH-quinone oxidoreductase subunit L
VLAHAWYIDEAIAKTVDGPGEAAFEGAATFDRVVIDGAVNGTGSMVKGLGSRLRAVQSGFVRSYALAVALGAVALMIYVVSRLSL